MSGNSFRWTIGIDDGGVVFGGQFTTNVNGETIGVQRFEREGGTSLENMGDCGPSVRRTSRVAIFGEPSTGKTSCNPRLKRGESVRRTLIDVHLFGLEYADGQPDGSFGIGGIAAIELGVETFSAIDGTLDRDGNLIVFGESQLDSFYFRMDATGTLDRGFGGGFVLRDYAVPSMTTLGLDVHSIPGNRWIAFFIGTRERR